MSMTVKNMNDFGKRSANFNPIAVIKLFINIPLLLDKI